MKLIHLVLGKANPLRMNGVNKLVNEMAETQHDLGHDVRLWGITINPVHDYPERNYKTVLFPSVFNKMRLDESIKNAISTLDADVVFHIHGSFIPEFYMVTKLLIEKGVQYIYTPHGALAPAAMNRRNWKKKWYFEFFEKKVIENAKTVVTTGQSVFDNLDKLVRVKKKVLIPNGQQKLHFQKSKAAKNEKIIFGFCGRIALEHKGLDLLLSGFRSYLNEGGDGELHIIGDGSEMPTLKKIATDLDLNNRIKFFGAKYGDDKFKILCQTDIFIHTSRMEGFPASVLEASALGLPCLISDATNFGGYAQKFGCGLVLKNNTPAFIAKEMLKAQQLFETGTLQEMGEQALMMVEKEFDWKKICSNLFQVYNSNTEEFLKEEEAVLICQRS